VDITDALALPMKFIEKKYNKKKKGFFHGGPAAVRWGSCDISNVINRYLSLLFVLYPFFFYPSVSAASSSRPIPF
jgi:hypothetical protein